MLRNEEQVGGVAIPLSLALAAIGGCMVPLELFPDPLRALANVAVLAGFAIVLGTVAAVALRRRLVVEG